MALNGDESAMYGTDAGSYGVTDYYSAGGLTNFYGDGDSFAAAPVKRGGFRGGRGAGIGGGPMRGAGGMRGGASLGGGRGGGFGGSRGGMGGARGGRGAPRGGGGPMRGAGRGASQRFNPLASAGGFGANGAAASAPLGHIVFAYNIGPMTSEDDVRQLFSLYGTVTKVDVIWDFAKNAGKGYAFVTMPNYEEAVYAISQLNGYNYAGKPLQVSFKSAKQ